MDLAAGTKALWELFISSSVLAQGSILLTALRYLFTTAAVSGPFQSGRWWRFTGFRPHLEAPLTP